eukprot:TRINITY_DN4166_c0_g1_i2.p1 TRINITY_DN4166_c0_g1~~TRINITY_DN4166_c0_g1_i2.p1  ORF type:complete len:197 (+),score=58.44 TRINITY_DN4166_c0_g1_i2:86-592(+)
MKVFIMLACVALGLAIAENIEIDNGSLACDDSICRVVCDYGFIPSGPYAVPLAESGGVVCEWPVGVVTGGYNRAYGGEDTFLASTEVYSIVRSEERNSQLPELPVERKGMFGGWVGGLAVVCGGEDAQGVVYSECFYFSISDRIWLFLQDLEVERSFASVVTLDGCLW